MATEELTFKAKVLKGFFWLSTGTFVGQLISWLSTIFVIRLLLPEDYGIMAMAGSFIFLLMTVSELGIGAALVQAEKITERETRQIYGFTLLTGIAGLLLCYAAAPLVANFYGEQKLVLPFRILAFNIVLIAFYLIPQSLLIREMNFKTKAKIDITGQIVSSLATLLLALNGWGVWSLIFGLLILHIVKGVSYNKARATRLRPLLSFQGAGKFIRYGLTLTGSRVLYSVYMLADTVIVGKFLNQFSLGIYSVALNLASLPAEKVLPIVNQITFTSYARIQHDRERIRKNLLMATRTVAFAGFPIFFGMAAVAQEAIPMILSAKWISVITPFQLLCVILPFKSLNPSVSSTLNAIGEARVNLINTAVTAGVMVPAFLLGVRYGIIGVCIAWIIAYSFVFLITISYSMKVLGIPLRQFLAELLFPFSASLVMVAVLTLSRMWIVRLSPLSVLATLISLGFACYIGSTYLFKRDAYREMKKILQS